MNESNIVIKTPPFGRRFVLSNVQCNKYLLPATEDQITSSWLLRLQYSRTQRDRSQLHPSQHLLP